MCFSLIPRKCCHLVLSFYAGLGGWASEVPAHECRKERVNERANAWGEND